MPDHARSRLDPLLTCTDDIFGTGKIPDGSGVPGSHHCAASRGGSVQEPNTSEVDRYGCRTLGCNPTRTGSFVKVTSGRLAEPRP
jgi:hypothetical protein